MAGLNLGDKVEMTLRGTLNQQRIISVFHYEVLTASTEADTTAALLLCAQQFDSGTNNPTLALLASQSEDYILETIRAQRIDPVRSIYVDATSGLPGTVGETSMPPNVAAAITRRGPFSGRKYVSTLHVAGIPVTGMLQGVLTAGQKTLLEVVATRLKSVWALSGDALEMRPIILNKPLAGPSYGIEATVVQNTARVMRRRTVGVGE